MNKKTRISFTGDRQPGLRKLEKHNKWIEGFEAGEKFFTWIKTFGDTFLILVCIISSALFLINLGLTQPSYLGVSVLLLKVLRLGAYMLILGLALAYICRWLANYLSKKETDVIEEVAYGRTKKEGIS